MEKWDILKKQLQQMLLLLNLDFNADTINQFMAYLSLLHKWQRAYNLVGYELNDYVAHILLENLILFPFIENQYDRIIDVGTGAGLPGLILAMACPHQHFTLLDSNGKKINFLTQAVRELGLRNVALVQSRVEGYSEAQWFPCLVSRAFASLNDIVEKSHHLLAPQGRMLLLKGDHVDHEIAELAAEVGVTKQRVQIPGIDRERYLVTLQWS
ncbi:MAG: 16S rRNA (guanine(527)-N(7))-methyltransferase RsmG [Legionellales bacterium]|nr:16S rRNA (guanine(527)-N(7))-methyltransferase RsmG [Legionellales bacterium]